MQVDKKNYRLIMADAKNALHVFSVSKNGGILCVNMLLTL